MTTAKNPVFIGLYLENCCLVGDQLLAGEIKFGGGYLLGGMSKFLAGRGGLHPYSPSKENPKQWEMGGGVEISKK